jgi:CheY-like chemotaxis protein
MTQADIREAKILVVGASPPFRTLIRGLLDGMGMRWVEEAETGSGALDLLHRFPADLAILEWHADSRNDLDCLRRIRQGADSADPFLPVIAITGLGGAFEAWNSGANEVLAKPIAAATLEGAIRKVLNAPGPYVEGGGYFGPDRRHEAKEFEGSERRHEAPHLVERPNF